MDDNYSWYRWGSLKQTFRDSNMNPTTIILVGVSLFAIFSFFKTADSVIEIAEKEIDKIVPGELIDMEKVLNDVYQEHGDMQGIDWRLLKALAHVESSENPTAINPADPSYGLMQILCTGDGERCENKFYLSGWPPTREELLNPDINVFFGAQVIRWNIDNYGFKKGIALYNAWHSNQDAPAEGPFTNQKYVDKVLQKYGMLKITEAEMPGQTVFT